MEPASFPQFTRLPPELRRQVWHFALRQPRVHNVSIDRTTARLVASDSLASSTSQARALLAASRESREEVLHVLTKKLPIGAAREGGKEVVLYFDPRADCICIVHGALQMFQTVADTALARAQGDRAAAEALAWTADVERLAIQAMDRNFQDDLDGLFSSHARTARPGSEPKAEFVAAFPRLRELGFVAVPSPDDPDSLVSSRDDDADHSWMRGRDDMEDWFCWVPSGTSWSFGADDTNDSQEYLFHSILDWQEGFQDRLRYPRNPNIFDEATRERLKRVKCRPMVHFQEGCKMPIME